MIQASLFAQAWSKFGKPSEVCSSYVAATTGHDLFGFSTFQHIIICFFSFVLSQCFGLPMKISTSGPNSSLPPPINWVTKPKPSPANTINHSLEHVEESETPARRLVPIFINPNHIDDLKEALQCLSESPHRQAKLVLEFKFKY